MTGGRRLVTYPRPAPWGYWQPWRRPMTAGLVVDTQYRNGVERQSPTPGGICTVCTGFSEFIEAHTFTTMTSRASAWDLSIPELLRVLTEKLGLECTRVQEIRLPPVVSTDSLETDVRASLPVHLNE